MTGVVGGREPTLQEQHLKEEVQSLLQEARWQMLERHPFVGGLAMRLDLIPIVDCRMTTATTDGRRLFVDAEFFKALTFEERLAILAHEVWHAAMRHFLRCGERDVKRFNYAADVETDLLLKADGFVVDLLPYDEEWVGQAAEWIYERIPAFLARFETKDMHIFPERMIPGTFPASRLNSGGESSQESDASEEDSPDKPAESAEGEEAEESNGTMGQESNGSSSSRGTSQVSHLPHIRHDAVFDPDFDVEFDSELEEFWEENLASQADKCRGCGKLPGHFSQFVKPAQKEPLDWRRLLWNYVTMLLQGERQWIPPNRRHVYKKLYLPSRARRPFLNIVVAMDTSGSTADFLPDFMAELEALSASFGEYKITLIQCDCSIRWVKEYTNEERMELSEFCVHGLGGTDLRPPFAYVLENLEEAPAVMMYITDGDGPAPSAEPPFPVIWCLTPDGVKPVEWGLSVTMDDGAPSES